MHYRYENKVWSPRTSSKVIGSGEVRSIDFGTIINWKIVFSQRHKNGKSISFAFTFWHEAFMFLRLAALNKKNGDRNIFSSLIMLRAISAKWIVRTWNFNIRFIFEKKKIIIDLSIINYRLNIPVIDKWIYR